MRMSFAGNSHPKENMIMRNVLAALALVLGSP